MANIQDYDYVPGTTDDGVVCWLRTTLATGCNVQSGMVTSLDIVYVLPEAPAGYQLKTRECPTDDVTVTGFAEDFTDPTGGGGGSDPVTDADQFIITGTYTVA